MSNLKKTLDDWAEKLAKKAAETNTPLQDSTDAFKAVTSYYAARQKTAKKQNDDDEEPGGFSFTDEVIHGGTEQRASVRARRNS